MGGHDHGQRYKWFGVLGEYMIKTTAERTGPRGKRGELGSKRPRRPPKERVSGVAGEREGLDTTTTTIEKKVFGVEGEGKTRLRRLPTEKIPGEGEGKDTTTTTTDRKVRA